MKKTERDYLKWKLSEFPWETKYFRTKAEWQRYTVNLGIGICLGNLNRKTIKDIRGHIIKHIQSLLGEA